jgi:pimeloyl-ACP methyl ester carboxylesterase
VGKIQRWWWALLLVPVLLAGGFAIWAESTPSPMSEARVALEASVDTDGVLVTTQDRLIFRPVEQNLSTGLIFYPGGRVDPRSYAPAARDIAAEGHLVVIVPMPLNLAFLAPDRASTVVASFSEIEHWVIGGHSLGGAMAARFAYQSPSMVEGLLLWASYPARGNDLSDRDILVTSIYGTRDGLATPEEITASRALVPPNTEWVEIAGGNHAQFGWYGPQSGDNAATISREAQQREAVAASVALLERVGQRRRE